MTSPEAKIARVVLALSTMTACTPSREDIQPAPIIEKKPFSEQEALARQTVPLLEQEENIGHVEKIAEIFFHETQSLTILASPDREIEITSQAPRLIEFFLRFKKDPADLPFSLQIVFTESKAPERFLWGKTENNSSIIYLGQIKDKPFAPNFSISTQASVVFASELCNLLRFDPTDFFEESWDQELELACDSIGLVIGAVLENWTYSEYCQWCRDFQYYIDEQPIGLALAVKEGIYQKMQEVFAGKPPVIIK